MKKWLIKILLIIATAMTVCSSLVASDQKVEEAYPVIVIGSGVGALTSAIYLGRAGLSPLVIEGKSPGGALAQSHCIQNWPGEIEISGPDLMAKMHKQAEHSGSLFRSEEVIDVDFSRKPFVITTRDVYHPEKIEKVSASSVIIAMGATPRFLGVAGEQAYWTKGVYNCALCDGALFKEKNIAVVGGGDAAVLEALYLSGIAKKVSMIVRKPYLSGSEEKRKQELFSKENIEIIFNSTVVEIKGNGEHLEQVVLKNSQEGSESTLDLDGLFLAIGSTPNTKIFEKHLDLDRQGFIVLKDKQETSVPGVYAIGDIVQGECKQAICAAGEGAQSTLQVEKHLSSLPKIKKPPLAKERTVKKEPSSVIEVRSKKQFEHELKEHVPTFIDFYASWCGPCKQLAPRYESWAASFQGKVKFLKVNVDDFPEVAETYKVKAMPTMLLVNKQGVVIEKKVGTQEIYSLMNLFLTAAQVDEYVEGRR